MKKEERKSFKEELEKNKSKRKLEELLDSYKSKDSYDEVYSIASPTALVFAITIIGLLFVSNKFNLDLSSNAFWGIVGIPTVATMFGLFHYSSKEEKTCKEKRKMILERLEELDEEEKVKELDKVKTIETNFAKKAESNDEKDIDKLLNDILFKMEKSIDDNKEISYKSYETKDKTLKKTRK